MAIGARSILSGSIWLVGAQVLGFILQFGYAAISARLVSPAVFGSYAVALASMVLVGILANAGLGQALTRKVALPRADERAIVSMSLLLGCLAAAAVAGLADVWVSLWAGGSDAVVAVRWLALSTLITPYMGVIVAFARRAGQFKFLATVQLLSAALGMVAGIALIFTFRNAESLVASLIITQYAIVVGVGIRHSASVWPGRVRKHDLRQLRFSFAVTGTNTLYYIQQNLPRWSIGRFLGNVELGYWNRAEVVTAVPFQSVQNAILQTMYPQFAHIENDVRRQKDGWTDMLVLSAWVGVPAGTIGYIVLPVLIPLLYGTRWTDVGSIVGVLALAYCLLPTMSVLAAGLEQRGMFKAILISLFLGIATIVPFCFAAVNARYPVLAGIGLGVSFAVQHALNLLFASRSRLIDIRRILVEYLLIGSVCLIVLVTEYCLLRFSYRWEFSIVTTALSIAFLGSVVVVGCGALASIKGLGPLAILRRRNLLSR